MTRGPGWIPWESLAALASLAQLDADQDGAYRIILDLIYATNDQLLDDDRSVARLIKRTVRKWRRLKAELVALGKIELVDGRITKPKCREVLASAWERLQNSAKGGRRSAEKRRNNDGDPIQNRFGANRAWVSKNDRFDDAKPLETGETGSSALPSGGPSGPASGGSSGPTCAPPAKTIHNNKRNRKDSEPVGSGPGGDRIETPLGEGGWSDWIEAPSDPSGFFSEPLPSTPAKQIFDRGVALLGHAGIEQRKARPLLGKWRKIHGDAAVIEALTAAERHAVSDPVAYIIGCLKKPNGLSHRDGDRKSEADRWLEDRQRARAGAGPGEMAGAGEGEMAREAAGEGKGGPIIDISAEEIGPAEELAP